MLSLGLGAHQNQHKMLFNAIDKLDAELVRLFQSEEALQVFRSTDELSKPVRVLVKLDELVRQAAIVTATCAEIDRDKESQGFRLTDLQSFPYVVECILRNEQRHFVTNEFCGWIIDILPWLYVTIESESDRRRLHVLNRRVKREVAFRDRVRASSIVNGTIFPIWTVDPPPKSFVGQLFLDPDEEPRLSPEQQRRFARWRRPGELYKSPLLIQNSTGSVRNSQLRQSPYVSNCSLISSFLIMAQHEGQKPGFATSMIFPKNSKGYPTLTPSGKYQVRLFWNGAYRVVTIDDLLPVDDRDNLLCVESTAGNELWATLLEKAYLKLVAGGYDLWTGSHSGIDIYALTGWPPDTILLNQTSITSEAKEAELWSTLKDGMDASRNNLVTASTRMDINEAATGLSRGHAFAVMDRREIKDGKKQLLLRNPWGLSNQNDDAPAGFWMDLAAMTKLFQAVHVNYDVSSFRHISHRQCQIAPGEDLDRFGFYHCTQYRIKPLSPKSRVWVMLSRDVNDATQLESTDNAVAMHAFEANERLFLASDAKQVLHRGKYASGPHSHLCKIEDAPDGGFVVVFSAYACKHQPVNCTLSVFSTSEVVSVEELPLELSDAGGFSRMIYSLPSPQRDITKGRGNHLWMIRFPSYVSSSSLTAMTLVTTTSSLSSPGSLSSIGDERPYDSVLGNEAAKGVRIRVACGTMHPINSSAEVRIWTVDIKNSSKTLLGTRRKEKGGFVTIEATIPSSLVFTRTSVRFVIEPCFAANDARGDGEDDDEDYFMEVYCDLLNFVLVAPTDAPQQVLLRKMLGEFRLSE